jgi:uncharacterized protein involved in exopolysaccharide biosynthesis
MVIGGVLGLICGAILSVVRQRKEGGVRRIAAFIAAGMVLGGAVAFLLPDEFTSTAVIRTVPAIDAGGIGRAFTAETLDGIIQREGLYQRDRTRKPAEDLVGRMRRNIQISRVSAPSQPDAGIYLVSFKNPDKESARRVTAQLVQQLITANLETARTSRVASLMEVLDPPNNPAAPSSPNRLAIVAFGVTAGLLSGLAAIHFRRPALV